MKVKAIIDCDDFQCNNKWNRTAAATTNMQLLLNAWWYMRMYASFNLVGSCNTFECVFSSCVHLLHFDVVVAKKKSTTKYDFISPKHRQTRGKTVFLFSCFFFLLFFLSLNRTRNTFYIVYIFPFDHYILLVIVLQHCVVPYDHVFHEKYWHCFFSLSVSPLLSMYFGCLFSSNERKRRHTRKKKKWIST